jgi:hypothetical protein
LLVDVLGDGVATFFPSSPTDFFSNTENEQIAFDVSGDRAVGLVLTSGSKMSKALRIGDL